MSFVSNFMMIQRGRLTISNHFLKFTRELLFVFLAFLFSMYLLRVTNKASLIFMKFYVYLIHYKSDSSNIHSIIIAWYQCKHTYSAGYSQMQFICHVTECLSLFSLVCKISTGIRIIINSHMFTEIITIPFNQLNL